MRAPDSARAPRDPQQRVLLDVVTSAREPASAPRFGDVGMGPRKVSSSDDASEASKKSPAAKAARKPASSGSRPPEKPHSHPLRHVGSRDRPLVERLRKICLAFPEAGERISHGEPTWFAGKGKVFAMLDNHHHGSAHLSVWLPQPMDQQETLIEADPARFFRPPYVGPSGWVGVVLDTEPDWKMVQQLVHDAFVHVATKKLVARLLPPTMVR